MNQDYYDRRKWLKIGVFSSLGLFTGSTILSAKTYLTPAQAKALICGNVKATKIPLTLTKAQKKAIKSASKVRVNNTVLNVYKTATGDWLIFDQIIGKHENIDMAFGLTKDGKVNGVEILVYRETYGHEIRGDKWRAQFHGKDHTERLKLDKQIKNISGATLSCRHVADAINRWTQTWNLVLRHL